MTEKRVFREESNKWSIHYEGNEIVIGVKPKAYTDAPNGFFIRVWGLSLSRVDELLKERDKEIAELKKELMVLKDYLRSLDIGTCSENKQGGSR